MKTEYLYLSTTQIRQAIRMILQDHVPEYRDLGLKEIRIQENRMVYVRDNGFCTYDRHLNYPHKIQHAYALYGFLKYVEHIAKIEGAKNGK